MPVQLDPVAAALQEERAAAKQEATARRRVEDRLMRARSKREQAAKLEAEAVAATGPAILDGADLGMTYDEMAELAGISRPRVAQYLGEQRGIAATEPLPPPPPLEPVPPAPKAAPVKKAAKKAGGVKKGTARR